MKQILGSIFLYRREFVVIVICFLIFVTALLFSSPLIIFWSNFSIEKEGVKIEAAIQQELEDISIEREEIISSRILNDVIKNNDLSQLGILIQTEIEERDLDFIAVTDKDGFVLARSGLSSQQGDNIFQTMIQGKNMAQGETVTAIVRNVSNPLTAVSGSYIFEQNKPIGSILVEKIFNDAYATTFQEKYLRKDGAIVFYTLEEGIVGDSFNDKDKTQLINAYFSLGSDIVAQNLKGLTKEIKISDDYYAIRHIVFPRAGIEKSPGGMFVFFPIRHNLYSLFLAVSITFLFFIFLILFLKFLHYPKQRVLMILFLAVISFVVIYFITINKLDNSAIELKKSPYLIYNSIIKFDPESDVVIQSSEKTIAIKVFTGGEAINVVNATVKYDPEAVEILDIITTNSFCDPSLFLERNIDKEKGEVRITCGIPNPGYSLPTGTVAELLMQPLSLKAISLEFAEETQVLANDGLGTNVLRMATPGYYQIVRQKFATADTEHPIPIFSPSHPNNNRWYKNKSIRLSWPQLSEGSYHYTLNHSPIIDAEDKIIKTVNNYLDITVLEDGIYYFHIQGESAEGNRGPISNFKIMVDSTPPSPPKIQASNEIIQKGEIVRLDFTSEDKLSGLQSGFYVKINEGILLPVKPPFYIPFLELGKYPIVIRVFDKANNFSDSSMVIQVND